VGHVDVNQVSFDLPDGRPLLREVSLRVGEGARIALVGPNGSGKTTLSRIISGDLAAHSGAVTRSGGLGVMRQFIGSVRDESTVRDLLLSVASDKVRAAAAEIDRTELAVMEHDTERDQLAYAQALVDWGDAGGYEAETLWDTCTVAALGVPYERAQWRPVTTLSGGEQKRVVLEALLRGPEEVLLLDEPDNYLDVPGKRWLEDALIASPKTVLFISHDRELLARVATRVATLEPGAAGSTLWVHPGPFGTYAAAREDRNSRLEELRRRWDEEHIKLKALVVMYRQKAAYNSDMAPKLQAAETRLRRFLEAGPPEAVPVTQRLRMRLTGGRTAKRAIVCERLELTGLMQPFDSEIWFGERLAVLGSNGSGKSHFLRLLACGGSDPDVEHQPWGRHDRSRCGIPARPGWAPGCGRAGSPRPTTNPRCSGGPSPRSCIAATNTATGAAARRRPRCLTVTAWPRRRSRPSSHSRVGSRRGSRSCCSSCPAPPCCCSTSRPTTSTWTRPRRLRPPWTPSKGPSWP
jgi:ATPase subunit of ABC transporter with duplicated ATPase domains